MKTRLSERAARVAARRWLALGLLSSTLTAAAAAAADAAESPPKAFTEGDVQAARAEFVRGAALAQQAQWDAALQAFERSYALRPHPITSYNLGYCSRAVGRSASARTALRRALAEHAAGTWGRLPDYLVELAERYLSEAERRVVQLDVRLEPADASLLIDGRAPEREDALVGRRATGHALVYLDPGTHVFVVSSSGKDLVATREFAPGEKSSILLSVPLVLPPERRASARPSAPAERRNDAPAPIDRRWAFVAMAAGLASVTAGTIAGVTALRERSYLRDNCGELGDECPVRARADLAALKRDADVSTVAFALGAVGLSVGGVALLVLPRKHRPLAGHAAAHTGCCSLVPRVGPGWAAIAGSF